MSDTTPVHLKPSETAVLHAASRIYAAHLATDPKGDDKDRVEHSVKTAIKMAILIDARVKSDNEMM